MVSRKDLFKWGTITIIVLFFIEMFFVVMYTPRSEENATPSPTPTSEGFSGVGAGSARVLSLGSDVLAECENATAAAQDAVRAVPGVTFALLSAGGVISARLNSSLEEQGMQNAISDVEDALWDHCEPRVYRRAGLSVEDVVNATNPLNNQSRIYNQRTLSGLFAQAGYRGVEGWVSPQSKVNESVGVALVVRLDPGNEPFVFIQEERPVFDTLQARPALVQVNVESLLQEGTAKAKVPWEKRGLNSTQLERQVAEALNGSRASASYDVKDQFSYSIAANDSAWNSTRAALGNLSFARGTSARTDSIIVQVDSNFTDKAEVVSAVLARVQNASAEMLSFPEADLSVEFNFTTELGFGGAMAAVGLLVPAQVEGLRLADVSFSNATDAKHALGVGALPAQFQAYVLGSAKEGDSITLDALATAKGKRLVSLGGRQEQ